MSLSKSAFDFSLLKVNSKYICLSMKIFRLKLININIQQIVNNRINPYKLNLDRRMIRQTLGWSLITLQGIMIFADADIRNRFLMIAGQIWPCRSAQMQQLGEAIRMVIAVCLIPAAFGNFWIRVLSLAMYAVFICNYYNPMVSKGASQAFFIDSIYDMLLLIFGLILIIQEIDNTFGPERQASTTMSIKSQINEEDVKDEELKLLHTSSQQQIPDSQKRSKLKKHVSSERDFISTKEKSSIHSQKNKQHQQKKR